MTAKKSVAQIASIVEELKPQFAAMSDDIWDYAELSFREHKSAAAQMNMLRQHGFAVTEGLADIETAFSGEAGSGKPVIAFLGDTIVDWKGALLAGYTWDSTLQKLK